MNQRAPYSLKAHLKPYIKPSVFALLVMSLHACVANNGGDKVSTSSSNNTASSSVVASSSSAPIIINEPPTISVSAVSSLKINRAGVISTNNRAIVATVADADSNIKKVELSINNTPVGAALTAPPYEWSETVFAGLPNGEHTIKVTVFDIDTNVSAQTTVSLTANQLPTISFNNLTHQQSFDIGSSVDIRINADDPDGSIASVELFLNNNSLGEKDQPPYAWLASDLMELASIDDAGDYHVKVKAIDNDNDHVIKNISFTINAPTKALQLGEVFSPDVFAPGPHGGCYIKTDQTAQCWGSTYVLPRDCSPHGEGVCTGRGIAPNNLGKVTALSGVHTGACAVLDTPRNNGSNLRCWGPEVSLKTPTWNDTITVSGGDRHACALRLNGDVACWGTTHIDEKNNYSADWAGKFPQPPANLKAKAIASSDNLACAIKEDDTFICWNGPYSTDPVPVMPDNLKVKDIAVGGERRTRDHVCVIKMNNALKCWGDANNSAIKNYTAGLKVKSIGAGDQITCAVGIDGTAQCWGLDMDGVTIPGNNFAEVGVNKDRAFFVKEDGSILRAGKAYKADKKLPDNAKVYGY
ncbi:Ig-like domain-containing protein [Marinagarivorans algicola]|uniref:Ig-like domain-containing protein n=1 Tax=Marinagarivorans algicola TaxID=1513270 RepID=UPI0006B9DB7E|nr:Ig-like domain-containing protein [Marinagarivorans algicola]